MDGWLKQSTAITLRIGPFLDDTDGKTAETGLTISQADVRLSKAGGAFAQKNDATGCTHDENGYYSCPLNATDTGTLGLLKLAVTKSGALPVWHTFMVLAVNVYDSLIAASDKLQVDMQEWIGVAPLALTSQLVQAQTNQLDSQAKADVNAEADTALADYDPPTKAEMDSGFAGLNDLSAAEVNAEVDAALVDYDPPTKAEMDSGFAGLNDPTPQEIWEYSTRALTDKADFALSAASRAAIWDEQEATLSLSFETLMYRIFTLLSHKMNVTDASGAAALRNAGDTGNIATGSITDDDTTTVRAAWSWV